MSEPGPELAIKHHGITVELQVGNGRLYFNPFEEYSDRKPRNADVIVSLISPGDVTGPREEHAFLSGFECYGTPETVYFVGDELHARWAAERARASEVAYKVPGTGAGVHRLRLGGDATVGGHAVRITPLTEIRDQMDRRMTVGINVEVAGRTCTYLQLAPGFLRALEHKQSDILLLLPEQWGRCTQPLAELIEAHPANHFVLISHAVRKREQEGFLRLLPAGAAAKVVFRQGKWKVPPLA